LKGRAIYTHR